jgi:hypothetical protein
MQTTFELNAEELDEQFINGLKELFKDRRLKITVEAEPDETSYLTSNPETRTRLMAAIERVDNGEVLSFTDAEFDEVSKDLEAGKKIDVERFRLKKSD